MGTVQWEGCSKRGAGEGCSGKGAVGQVQREQGGSENKGAVRRVQWEDCIEFERLPNCDLALWLAYVLSMTLAAKEHVLQGVDQRQAHKPLPGPTDMYAQACCGWARTAKPVQNTLTQT